MIGSDSSRFVRHIKNDLISVALLLFISVTKDIGIYYISLNPGRIR